MTDFCLVARSEHWVSCPIISWTPLGMTSPPPWTICSNAKQPFLGGNSSWCPSWTSPGTVWCPLILLLFIWEKRPTPTLLCPHLPWVVAKILSQAEVHSSTPGFSTSPPTLSSTEGCAKWIVLSPQQHLAVVPSSSCLSLNPELLFPQPAVLQDKPAPARVLCTGSRSFRVNTCSRTFMVHKACQENLLQDRYCRRWGNSTSQGISIHTFPSPHCFCSVSSFLPCIFMDAPPTLLMGLLCPVHSSH